jgi:hypothetical protein
MYHTLGVDPEIVAFRSTRAHTCIGDHPPTRASAQPIRRTRVRILELLTQV